MPPVYLFVDGNQRFWKPERVKDIATKYIDVLGALKASAPDPDEDWERSDTEGALLTRWNADKKELDRHIEQALGEYEKLMQQAAAHENQQALIE